MHFSIYVEDSSGKRMLETLVPSIIGANHTSKIYPYKGIGPIPKSMRNPKDASKRILLDNIVKILSGTGKTQAGRPYFQEVIIIVCDLDDRCLHDFRNELLRILAQCHPKPNAFFCIAVEEGEAWMLGDVAAIRKAYPSMNENALKSYQQDSICGTWEKLADITRIDFKKKKLIPGNMKHEWAEKIPQHMDVENNQSPSFCYFRDKLRSLI